MCIASIIFKPLPLTDLQSMEQSNPDGGGVAWLDPDIQAIRFVRGVTAHEIFDMQEAGQMTYPYLLHFRWATIGIHGHQNVHPFPTGEQTLHGERSGSAQSVFMHNGTWSGYNRYIQKAWEDGIDIPAKKQLESMSDTAVAAWLCGQYPEILDEMGWATAIAFVGEENGELVLDIQRRGDTWTELDGNWYSNLHWMPWQKRFASDHDVANRQFWTSYARSKGWSWYDDAVTIPAKDVREAWTDEEWQEYLQARYGSETAAEALRQDKLAELESGMPDFEDLTEDQLREFLGPDYEESEPYELGPDIESEDPAVVNAWLAQQMVA